MVTLKESIICKIKGFDTLPHETISATLINKHAIQFMGSNWPVFCIYMLQYVENNIRDYTKGKRTLGCYFHKGIFFLTKNVGINQQKTNTSHTHTLKYSNVIPNIHPRF